VNIKSMPTVKLNIFDRIVNAIAPSEGLKRLRARASLNWLEGSGYITPASNRKSMRGWSAESGTADQDTIFKLSDSRRGARDLAMNSPIALAPLKRELTNVIGWGLIPHPRLDREFLGLSDEAADRWERDVMREFGMWSKSTECDVARTQTFYGLQGLVFYNTILSGDVFVLLPYIRRPRQVYALKVMVLEADRVSNPHHQLDTNQLAGGVEVDEHGAPIAYHINAPTGPLIMQAGTIIDTWKRVPAFGEESNRRNVLHIFDKERPGQRRGMPKLAPVIETLKNLSRLSEAELTASVINSFFTVFVKTNPVAGGMQQGFVPEERVTDEDKVKGDENLYEMGSGNIIELDSEGQDITLADPKRPNDNFEPFFLSLLKQIGASMEIPFEQLILHFSSSYSAARAALLEAWKFYRRRRAWTAETFCQPVYEEWLTEAIMRGRISAPGFFQDPVIRFAWSQAAWTGPGQGQIDPLKETKASAMRIEKRLSNYEAEYAQIHGGDSWRQGMTTLSRENQMLTDKEIPPTAASPTGQGQSATAQLEDRVIEAIDDNDSEGGD
jgi:lambda family phage portal protein